LSTETWTLLNGSNTYTGMTCIPNGTLVVTHLADGGQPSSIGCSPNIAENLELGGGTLSYVGPGDSTNRLFCLTDNSRIDASGGGTLTFTNTGSMGFFSAFKGKGQKGPGNHTLTLSGTSTGVMSVSIGDYSPCAITSLAKVGPGLWALKGTNTYTGQTVVAGGTLELGHNAQSCILSGSGVDIQVGKVAFDYAGAADPLATIQGLLNYSCDNGRWDRGQFRDTKAAATGLTLGLYDDTSADTVTVMATYSGDFNLDGVVDNLDRAILYANVFTGTMWQQGDANGDGVVNGLDRDVWLTHFGLSAPLTGALPASPSAMIPAPEPATLALLLCAGIFVLARSRRSRFDKIQLPNG
jgi:autotransporter-associated beta strand protein